jgi:hypothetical protein
VQSHSAQRTPRPSGSLAARRPGFSDDEIPDALIATIDTPVELQLPIYQEVRDAIGVRVPVAVRVQT